QDSLILPRGYFFVQTPFSFITGMLPLLFNKAFSKNVLKPSWFNALLSLGALIHHINYHINNSCRT
ncbi:hypothetical protein, partial [Anaerosolibacter sp.]|uniref:hypothetical protein n=1 Tax=Anaerosolibacter sp. TaxID=1872527 RepID=UPI0039F0A59C